MADQDMSYIARCKCGCGAIAMAIVDRSEHVRDVANEVAKAIREGYAVERVTVEYVRKAQFGCVLKKA